MKSSAAFWFSALLLLSPALAIADQVSRDVDDLRGQLINEQVTSVEITHIPYDTPHQEEITVDQLRGMAKFKCTVDITPKLNESLLAAIDDAHFLPVDGHWDLYWALQINIKGRDVQPIIFLNGRTFTGSGQRGILIDQPVALNRSLAAWLINTTRNFCPDIDI
jgi:hypothetical protein